MPSIAAITYLKLTSNDNCLLFLYKAFHCLPGVEHRRWYEDFNSMAKSHNYAQDDTRCMAELRHHCQLRFLSTKVFVIHSVHIRKSFPINLDSNTELNFWMRRNRLLFIYYFRWRCGPTRAITSSCLRFLDHTQRRITVGRTPLHE